MATTPIDKTSMATSSPSNKYRAKEVCDLLEVSKKTLYNLESRGFIPPVARDWRGWRVYDESHIDAIRRYKASKAREVNREM